MPGADPQGQRRSIRPSTSKYSKSNMNIMTSSTPIPKNPATEEGQNDDPTSKCSKSKMTSSTPNPTANNPAIEEGLIEDPKNFTGGNMVGVKMYIISWMTS